MTSKSSAGRTASASRSNTSLTSRLAASAGPERVERVQAAQAPALALELHDVLDERRDEVGDLRSSRRVIGAVRAGSQAAGGEAADHAPAAVEGQQQGRAEAGLAHHVLDRAFDGEAVVVAQLVEPQHAAAEHGGERALADG